jgi:hypothetical protein
MNIERRVGTFVLRLRLEHESHGPRRERRAYKRVERHVLSQYGATRLASGDHELKIAYLNEDDLEERIDDLLFEIAGEAQLYQCFSQTEVWLEGTDRRW